MLTGKNRQIWKFKMKIVSNNYLNVTENGRLKCRK